MSRTPPALWQCGRAWHKPFAPDLNCDGKVDITDVLQGILRVFGAPLSAKIDTNGNGCPDACEVSCGDCICQELETCASCPQDCGPCPETGACCKPGGGCFEGVADECAANGGSFSAGVTCAEVGCELAEVFGCCLGVGVCQTMPMADCQALGGTLPPNLVCNPGACGLAPGACCMPTGQCVEFDEVKCHTNGGYFHGVGVSCQGGEWCLQVTPGACCDPDTQQCTMESWQQCQGWHLGAFTQCGVTPCPAP